MNTIPGQDLQSLRIAHRLTEFAVDRMCKLLHMVDPEAHGEFDVCLDLVCMALVDIDDFIDSYSDMESKGGTQS